MKIEKPLTKKRVLLAVAAVALCLCVVGVALALRTMQTKAGTNDVNTTVTISKNYQKQIADRVYEDVMVRMDDAALAVIGQRAVTAYLEEHQIPVSDEERDEVFQILLRELEADGGKNTSFFTQEQKAKLAQQVQDSLEDSLEDFSLSEFEDEADNQSLEKGNASTGSDSQGNKNKAKAAAKSTGSKNAQQDAQTASTVALKKAQQDKLKQEILRSVQSSMRNVSASSGTAAHAQLSDSDWERVTAIINKKFASQKKVQTKELKALAAKYGKASLTKAELADIQSTIADSAYAQTKKQIVTVTTQLKAEKKQRQSLEKQLGVLSEDVTGLDQKLSELNSQLASGQKKDEGSRTEASAGNTQHLEGAIANGSDWAMAYAQLRQEMTTELAASRAEQQRLLAKTEEQAKRIASLESKLEANSTELQGVQARLAASAVGGQTAGAGQTAGGQTAGMEQTADGQTAGTGQTAGGQAAGTGQVAGGQAAGTGQSASYPTDGRNADNTDALLEKLEQQNAKLIELSEQVKDLQNKLNTNGTSTGNTSGSENSGSGNENGGNGNEGSGNGNEGSGNGNEGSGNGNESGGNGNVSGGSVNESGGNENESGGSVNESGGNESGGSESGGSGNGNDGSESGGSGNESGGNENSGSGGSGNENGGSGNENGGSGNESGGSGNESGGTGDTEEEQTQTPEFTVMDMTSGELKLKIAQSSGAAKASAYKVYIAPYTEGQAQPSSLSEYGEAAATIHAEDSGSVTLSGLSVNTLYSICVTEVSQNEKEETSVANQKVIYLFDTSNANAYEYHSYALEYTPWEIIDKIGADGNAPLFFHVGDEKTILLNGKTHRVRIIGFNTDKLDKSDPNYLKNYNMNGKIAAYTFQFTEALTDLGTYELAASDLMYQCSRKDYGYLGAYGKADGIYAYREHADTQSDVSYTAASYRQTESMKEFVEGALFSAMPQEVAAHMKIANKYGRWDGTADDGDPSEVFSARLFALSDKEITKSEGYEYKVYDGGAYNFYRVGGSAPTGWLRTASDTPLSDKLEYYTWNDGSEDTQTAPCGKAELTGYCYGMLKVQEENGKGVIAASYKDTLGIAPAFCY